MDHGRDAAACVESLAAARGGSDEGTFGGGHGDVDVDAIDLEGAGDTEGDGDVAHDVLAAGAENPRVVVVFVGDTRGF